MVIRRLLKWSLLVVGDRRCHLPADPDWRPVGRVVRRALPSASRWRCCRWRPGGVPRPAGIAAQGVLGVYIGTTVHQDAVDALGPHWPIVIAVAVATLLLSVVCGALLSMHRDVTPLTGSLALLAGGASGLVAAIATRTRRRRSAWCRWSQYLRVALVTASMPVVVTLVYHCRQIAPGCRHSPISRRPLVFEHWHAHRAGGGRRHRRQVDPSAGCGSARAAGADGAASRSPGFPSACRCPMVLVQVGYALIGWQAGLAFTRDSMRAVGPACCRRPSALIVVLSITHGRVGRGARLTSRGVTPAAMG